MNRELFQLKHSWTICLACVIRCPSGYKASPCSIVPVTEQGLLRPHHFITERCMLEQPQRAQLASCGKIRTRISSFQMAGTGNFCRQSACSNRGTVAWYFPAPTRPCPRVPARRANTRAAKHTAASVSCWGCFPPAYQYHLSYLG